MKAMARFKAGRDGDLTHADGPYNARVTVSEVGYRFEVIRDGVGLTAGWGPNWSIDSACQAALDAIARHKAKDAPPATEEEMP